MSEDDFIDRWGDCTRCSLGVQRKERRILNAQKMQVTPAPVILLGDQRGILFVGDPVGETEEATSDPFSSPKYDLVKRMLERERIPNHFTHALLCRSCVPVKSPETGELVLRKGQPIWRDGAPPKDALDACRERLCEEIYLLDPLLVVALGPLALRTLTNKHYGETDRGRLFDLEVTGRSTVPALTPKGVWERKIRGVVTRPVKPRIVHYPVYLTGSLDKVMTYAASQDPDREPAVFIRDLARIASMWRLYSEVMR